MADTEIIPRPGFVPGQPEDELELHPLAELVPQADPRRRILENLDRIARGALRNVRTGVNKGGYEFSYPAPDWNAALKAQVAAAAILNPKMLSGAADGKPVENPVLAAIERAAERMIRDEGKVVEGSERH